jgi:hypothetical protein
LEKLSRFPAFARVFEVIGGRGAVGGASGELSSDIDSIEAAGSDPEGGAAAFSSAVSEQLASELDFWSMGFLC